ncbi:GLE1-like protein-domain-containing protein [Kalaharituber pfeilii]|nr:GLE1-like protein-domain-containing protein [Kalaharituber pfeilii]
MLLPPIFKSEKPVAMVTSSPVGSGMSPKLHLLQGKRLSTGSYGCTREVLHPLDPRAEPSAVLYYDSNSDDELEDEEIRLRALSDKPIKRRLSFGTDLRSKKQASENSEASHKGSVYYPSLPRTPRYHQAHKESSPLQFPRLPGSPRPERVAEDHIASQLSAISLDASSAGNANIHTPQRRAVHNPNSQRIDAMTLLRSPFTNSHLSDTNALENTPAGVVIDLEGFDREALVLEIQKCLEAYKEIENVNTQETISRLETLIERLEAYSESEDLSAQIQFVLEELVKNGVINEEVAQELAVRCQDRRTKMSHTAIIARWLVHGKVYDTNSNTSTPSSVWTPQTTPDIWRYAASPSSPFMFRSPMQQDFSPLQSRNFYTSPNRNPKRKSEMAESIAALREQLLRLQCNSESVGDARKRIINREYELSMKSYYDRALETSSFVKVEMSLDTQLQRLLNERRAQEEAARQAKLQAEEQARKEAQRIAAERAAQIRAAEEAERRRQEEEAARKRAAEEAEKRAREETMRKAQEQQDALRRKELEEQQKKKDAADREREAALAETARKAEEQRKKAETAQAVEPPTEAGDYGRKSLAYEKVAMKKLLAALKDVRKRVEDDRDLHKKVNAKKRSLNPKLGQLNGEAVQTNLIRNFIHDTLAEVKAEGGALVEAGTFQLNRDPRIEAKPPSEVPLVFIWLVNELGKMVARQVEAESAVSIKTANPIGVAVVSALARETLLANGRSFIDIIVARLWKKCPILQGALGPEDTVGSREALGWIKVGDQWESDEAHVNRMVGYSAGFAAIAGRNFTNASALNNPYPPFNLWFLLAYFANNADKLTNTHYFCIKTMLEVAGDTLKKVYGRQGAKLITTILKQLTEIGVRQQFAGAIGLQALGAKFEKEQKFL